MKSASNTAIIQQPVLISKKFGRLFSHPSVVVEFGGEDYGGGHVFDLSGKSSVWES